jgi:hypothetical protein
MACEPIYSEQVVQEEKAGKLQNRIKNYEFYSADNAKLYAKFLPSFSFYFYNFILCLK